MTARGQAGRDPLHYAAKNNDADGVRERLAAAVDVNLTETRSRYTPLHFAVQDGAADAARVLLDAGADVQAICNPGVTPLHLAVIRWRQSPDGAIIRLVLERGADRTAVEANRRNPAEIPGTAQVSRRTRQAAVTMMWTGPAVEEHLNRPLVARDRRRLPDLEI